MIDRDKLAFDNALVRAIVIKGRYNTFIKYLALYFNSINNSNNYTPGLLDDVFLLEELHEAVLYTNNATLYKDKDSSERITSRGCYTQLENHMNYMVNKYGHIVSGR